MRIPLRTILILSFSALAACLVTTRAYAAPTAIGESYPLIMRGVRPLGMGNAFIAMPGTDPNGQFYNPSSINDYEETRRYHIGVPMVDFNIPFFSSLGDLFDLRSELRSSSNASQKLEHFDNYIHNHEGEFDSLYTSMPLFHVRHKYYALGMIGDSRTVLSFRNIAFPNFDFKIENTMGIVGGSAYGFFDDALQVGGNLKLLFRMGREDEVTGGKIVIKQLSDLIGFETWQKGFGAGIDVGSKYKLPILRDSLRPVVGLVIQDVGNTRFTGGAHGMSMSVSTGIGLFPIIGDLDIAVLADMRELNQEMAIVRRFHFGTEIKFHETRAIRTQFTLRAGCNQGYPAAGFTAKWPSLVSLHFAFYGEEAGKYTTAKAIWRYATSLAFDF